MEPRELTPAEMALAGAETREELERRLERATEMARNPATPETREKAMEMGRALFERLEELNQ